MSEKLKVFKEIYEENLKEYPDARRSFELYVKSRQEAIKWILDCPKRRRFGIECKDVNLGKSRKMKCEACMRFVDFFNIEDEELTTQNINNKSEAI